jgi:hypothetical protein
MEAGMFFDQQPADVVRATEPELGFRSILDLIYAGQADRLLDDKQDPQMFRLGRGPEYFRTEPFPTLINVVHGVLSAEEINRLTVGQQTISWRDLQKLQTDPQVQELAAARLGYSKQQMADLQHRIAEFGDKTQRWLNPPTPEVADLS